MVAPEWGHGVEFQGHGAKQQREGSSAAAQPVIITIGTARVPFAIVFLGIATACAVTACAIVVCAGVRAHGNER